MTRIGLLIALGLWLVIGLVFGLYAELDLKLAALFYDPATHSFPLSGRTPLIFARNGGMWIAWGLAAPSLIAFAAKMLRPDRKMLISGRAMVFVLITMLFAAGLLTNFTFKRHWHRPRPAATQQFGGPWQFMPWWDPRGQCGINCSFDSGEGATAFWTIAPAALAPPQWRPLAYGAAITFGVIISGLRMAFGGHYFTDVTIAGLMTFIVIWLMHGLIYRWPSTRWTDAGVDAALTRFAWPGYRLVQRWRGRETGSPPQPTDNEASRLEAR